MSITVSVFAALIIGLAIGFCGDANFDVELGEAFLPDAFEGRLGTMIARGLAATWIFRTGKAVLAQTVR